MERKVFHIYGKESVIDMKKFFERVSEFFKEYYMSFSEII